MSETQVRPVLAARVAPLVLSERERELIELLRRIDLFRAGRCRIVVINWNGVRPIVLDGQQIS